MEMSLVEIWGSMGLLARLIAVALVAMGFASLMVSLERLFVLHRSRVVSVEFSKKARPLLEGGEVEALRDLAQQHSLKHAALPALMRFGLDAYVANRDDNAVGPVEMTRRELARRLESLASEARRGMGILASTGSTAPFIGLFGTVIGIITAFQGIAAAGGGGIGAVSAGIAEALIVTAVGLAVAIASVLTFNYLTARFDQLDMMMQHAAGELVDYLEAAGGRDA